MVGQHTVDGGGWPLDYTGLTVAGRDGTGKQQDSESLWAAQILMDFTAAPALSQLADYMVAFDSWSGATEHCVTCLKLCLRS